MCLPEDPPLKLVYTNRQPVLLKQPQHVVEGLDGGSLDYFREIVAPSLEGTFDANLFSHIACQIAHSSPSVANAIAALAKCWYASLAQHSQDVFNKTVKIAALQHYATAVRNARQLSLARNGLGNVELLICNLLFICFENLQQHFEAALQQMSSGLYLFCAWQNSRDGQISNHATIDQDEVNSQLSNSYHRLMVQAILFLDTHCIDRHIFLPCLHLKMEGVPEYFTDIEQARDCLNQIISTMILQSISIRFLAMHDQDKDFHYKRPIFSFRNDILSQFDTAFHTLRQKYPHPTPRQELGLIMVELMQILVQILHSVSLAQSEMEYDNHTSHFTRILTLSQRTIHLKNSPHGPSMFTEILPPLGLVARSCRHPSIRRQAISLLRTSDLVEGVWNGHMLACVAEKMMEIEEMGLETGEFAAEDIRPAARLATQKALIHSARRVIDVTFVRGQRELGGLEVLRYEVRF